MISKNLHSVDVRDDFVAAMLSSGEMYDRTMASAFVDMNIPAKEYYKLPEDQPWMCVRDCDLVDNDLVIGAPIILAGVYANQDVIHIVGEYDISGVKALYTWTFVPRYLAQVIVFPRHSETAANAVLLKGPEAEIVMMANKIWPALRPFQEKDWFGWADTDYLPSGLLPLICYLDDGSTLLVCGVSDV